MRSKRQEFTLISENSSGEGELKVSGSLVLLGSFKGDIESETLEIGPNGRFIGNVEATNITISGYFEGELVCHSLLAINKAATVKGKIACCTLSVEPGGMIKAELFQFESMDTKLIPFYDPKRQSKK
jgi:cytoskeletal protein CcmA (bactofilin family)